MSILFEYVIVGLGKTGISCAEYFIYQRKTFFLVDTRIDPPQQFLAGKNINVPILYGIQDYKILLQAKIVVVSPGIPLNHSILVMVRRAGRPIISDIDIFRANMQGVVAGITGTNGKSTVVKIIGTMAKYAGIKATIAGNIGVPVLDVLRTTSNDMYILELSSFQLERSGSLSLDVALLLNITPDHLDNHLTFSTYVKAKHRIFESCKIALFCLENQITKPNNPAIPCLSFTSGTPFANRFGIIWQNEQAWLARGEVLLMPVNKMRIKGKHNWLNALAALATGEQLGFSIASMLVALKNFTGLPHRCQWVSNKYCDWFNDSKGTNEAATIAAIQNLSVAKKKCLILIAGGDGKGADFCQLAISIIAHVKLVVLLGKDANKIAKAIKGQVRVKYTKSVEEAVFYVATIVQPQDIVLFSPACTSLDMFANYQERGNCFMDAVRQL